MHKHHFLRLTVHSLLKPQRLLRHEDFSLDEKFWLLETLSLWETVEILMGGNAHVSGSMNTVSGDVIHPGGPRAKARGLHSLSHEGLGEAGHPQTPPMCLGVTKQGRNYAGHTLCTQKSPALFKRAEKSCSKFWQYMTQRIESNIFFLLHLPELVQSGGTVNPPSAFGVREPVFRLECFSHFQTVIKGALCGWVLWAKRKIWDEFEEKGSQTTGPTKGPRCPSRQGDVGGLMTGKDTLGPCLLWRHRAFLTAHEITRCQEQFCLGKRLDSLCRSPPALCILWFIIPTFASPSTTKASQSFSTCSGRPAFAARPVNPTVLWPVTSERGQGIFERVDTEAALSNFSCTEPLNVTATWRLLTNNFGLWSALGSHRIAGSMQGVTIWRRELLLPQPCQNNRKSSNFFPEGSYYTSLLRYLASSLHSLGQN